MYDSKATLVTRLTDIRTELAKARKAISYSTGGGQSLTRSYQLLLQEEKTILEQINAIDSTSTGGIWNRAEFIDPT